MKLTNKQTLKNGINLKLWLPILQSNIQELNSYVDNFAIENPFIEIIKKPNRQIDYIHSNSGEYIENISSDNVSLYDTIEEQLCHPLFPTPISQSIAFDILEDINAEGYFDGNVEEIAKRHNVSLDVVEGIRQRFMYLEPKGVGAKDLQECLLFQLYDLDLNSDLEESVKNIILNFDLLTSFISKQSFCELSTVFNKFSYPPAINFIDDPITIIPDFEILIIDSDLVISYNDLYSNKVVLNNYFKSNNEEISKKIKEARKFIDMLQLRKETLHKILLMIIDVQKEFFEGGSLNPLTMQSVADELSFTESTISRAVSNKYLECSRGIFSLKHFFINKVEKEDLSSNKIKEFLKNIIENESQTKPYSDAALVPIVNEEFSIKISRRAITKYRLSLDILSSRDRKKIYDIKDL